MATKPTERILDWASGGTTTDPGGAKEAAGWLVDERPPANWWNWVWNSFGKWLTYFETLTDDHEEGVVRAHGIVRTGASPSIVFDGKNVGTVALNGTDIQVNLSVTWTSTDAMTILATAESPQWNMGASPVDTNSILLEGTNTINGAAADFSSAVVDIHFIVLGTLP